MTFHFKEKITMINITISANPVAPGVKSTLKNDTVVCKRKCQMSIKVGDGQFANESLILVAFGKNAEILQNFTKPKIFVTGELVDKKDQELEFHISAIFNS
jgi:hypothetical protein